MNEFDENSHQEIDDENFYEYQMQSKKEISQLKDEINVLKAQYDEAMSFTSKVEEFSEENKNLKKQLLEIRLSNDDLTRRLQISQQAIADLSKENEKIKLRANDSCCTEITDLQTQLGIAKTENINISSRFQSQISELKSSLYSFESENAVLKKQQQKILQVVGKYFNQVFQNSEDLCNSISELKNKPVKQNSEEKEIIETPSPKKDEKLQHLRSKYQAEKDKRKDLQMTILKMKKKLEQLSLEHEEEINNCKDKIIQQSNEIKRLELLNQQKMLPTGPRPPELKSVGCQIILSNLDESEQILSFKQQVAKANSQIDAQDSSISILRTQNDSLIQQLENSKLTKDQMSSKLKQLNSKYNEIERELHQQKKENAILTEKLNQKNKVETTKSANSTPQNDLKIKLMNEELQNKQKTIDNLENLCNQQKDEIISLSTNKEKMVQIIERQNEILNLFNNEILSQKSDEKKPKIVEKIVTIEPKFEWNVGNIPDDIKDIVHDISSNESMSIESRIKSVFLIINKWISQNVSSKDNGISQMSQQYQEILNEYNDFKNQIITILELTDSGQSNQSIIDSISHLSIEFEKIKNELNEINQLHDQIFEITDVNDFDSLIDKLKCFSTDNQQLIEKVETESKKRKSLKKQYVLYLNEKEKEISSLKDLIHTNKENSKKQINHLQKTINDLQSQNGTLIERIKELIQIPHQGDNQTEDLNFLFQRDDSDLLKPQTKPKIKEENNDHDNINDELSIAQSNMEKEELQDQVKNLENTLNSWKEAVNQSRDENSQILQKMSNVKQKYENKMSQLQKKHEIEIANQNKTIKELSNQMKRKEEDHQVVINRLNLAIQHSNKLYEEALQKLSNLTYSYENEKKSIESRIEAIERAKKLSEAQLKAKILSLDSNYAILIEEEKQKGETEKRELIEFFAKTFRNFADINMQLNEESFHEMVLLLKSQFDKHQRSEDAIRKLIKANNNDSIVESITQFIIQNHPQLQKKSQ